MTKSLSERDKALAGLPYTIMDPELKALRQKAHRLVYAYNGSEPMEDDPPSAILAQLFGRIGRDVFIEVPFHCPYGVNIHLGDGVYMNSGCVILDCATP